MRSSMWPNIVTASRIAAMPPVLMLALTGHRLAFAVGFLAALSTDMVDGYLARRLGAATEFGRKLDSLADYACLFVGLSGVLWLWPDIVRHESAWFGAVFGAFFIAIGFTRLRLGRVPYYHTWLSKTSVVACVLAAIPMFAGWTAVPARIIAVFQVLVAVEVMAIAMLVPSHAGEMPTVWHAWRMRRAQRAGSRAAAPAEVVARS